MTKQTRVSPHGGYLTEGQISSGTLRMQDLLRAFANEYERLLPFNSYATVTEARAYADRLDEGDCSQAEAEEAADVLVELIDELDRLASPHGLYFGAHEGDGACFGFWKLDHEENDS